MGYIIQNQYGVITVNDEATAQEPKEVRFITPEYKELFCIPDGGQILISYKDGTRKTINCKYLDEYHFFAGRTYHVFILIL